MFRHIGLLFGSHLVVWHSLVFNTAVTQKHIW